MLPGAGTLYAAIHGMTNEGLIERTVPPDDAAEMELGPRWRFYTISRDGREVLTAEIRRLKADLEAARAIMPSPA